MGYPFRNFSPALVTAVNEAKLFQPFDLTTLRWRETDPDNDGRAARDAVGLALRFQPQAGQNPVVLPTHLGPMTCLPLRAGDGSLVEQRLIVYLPYDNLSRLRHDQATGEHLDAGNVRIIYGLSSAMNTRLRAEFSAHFSAGRLEPIFERGVTLLRTADNSGVGQINQSSDLNNPYQLNSWLDGNSAVWWRFAAGVARNDATLLTLQAGDTLKLFVEVGFTMPDRDGLAWYRVNPGYVLKRLREAGETDADYDYLAESFTTMGVANGQQAAYETMPTSNAGGLLAPGEIAPRSELAAVSGGSLGSVVLQPVGVVPPPLFSFITSDRITVFSARLAGQSLRVRCAQATLARRDLESTWDLLQSRYRGRNVRETFSANASSEFQATDLAYQLQLNQPGYRPPDLEDALVGRIGYGVMGWHTGSVAGAGVERTFVPQDAPEYRPDHPVFKPKLNDQATAAAVAAGNAVPDLRNQLRRLYPLRYYLAADGDQDTDREFVVTQDDTDCVRQEYAFHLNWAQTGVGLFYYQGDHAYQAGDVPAGGHEETVVGGQPAPRYTSLDIPARNLFRPLAAGEYDPILVSARPRYRTTTAAPAAWRDIYDNEIVPAYDDHLEAIKRIANGIAPPAGMVVPPVFGRFITLLQGLPPGGASTADPVFDFLSSLPSLQNALTQLANTANDRLQINSFWRPPEHNETVSELRNSPHQDMRGFDIQQAGGQSPLNLLALHSGGEMILATTAQLSQVLLEHRSRLFVYAGYDDALANRVVTRVGNTYRLVLVTGGPAVDLNAFWGASPVGEDEPVPRRGVPHPRLLDEFRRTYAAFMAAAGRPPDWPNPTVDRMYFYALSGASHVHFTVRA